jgi:hypothetical protein
MIIHRGELTTAERKAIEERYAPYHRFEEFWAGYNSYQDETGRYCCPHDWNSVAGRAWHQGSDAAMHVRWKRKIPARDEYERDDRESALQIATWERVADKYQKRKQADQLRQAIELGTQLAEEEALFKLTMKAKQVAELDRQRPRLVWDRERGYIE